MVIDSDRIFLDYSTVSTWWDDCIVLNRVKDSRVQLGEDFIVESVDYNFNVWSHGHMLFRYVKNPPNSKTRVNFYIVAVCSEEQFKNIYRAFMQLIDKNYEEMAVESQYKEMVDEPNSQALIQQLSQKYGN